MKPFTHLLGSLLGRSFVVDDAGGLNDMCCKAIESAGLTHVLYANDEQYSNRISSYWSVSAQLTPNCIVQPLSTEEVTRVVKTLVADADCRQTQFAIRSGGHSTWAGSNNIQDGVTIDLGLMNTTTFDPDTSIASIEPGSRWGQVYATLDPLGVTVAGGRAGTVGVAGFLTGGGNSFYTAQQGFACDNVRSFEIVLADGEVINANANENSDLFQVLKGGSGANFGIVTKFDVQAFEAGNLWGGTMIYPKSVGQQHIEAYHAWTENVNNYPEGSSIIFWSYQPALEDIVILAAYEDTTGNEAPPGFDGFMAIPDAIASTMRIASHKALTDELEQAAGYRNIWFTLTFKNDIRIYQKIVELHEQLVNEWKADSPDPNFITQCMFQSIATSFSQHSVAKGGNVLGLNREMDNVVMLLYDIAVMSPELEVLAREKLRKSGEAMKQYAASLNGLIDWTYMNYADSYQNPLGSYGLENVAKIRAAAAKYDPKQVFQTRAPGGFKISQRLPACDSALLRADGRG
ncbi:FAD-binding domain-containing protein [Dothidotthia symphoricarpi CBS 119687]|uniref:FAD-binding domain-containing protein n=1 Tax=Dothidotthia symphoricarpi CBS 119687 TaxID=1392245 RepID=A0A6A6AHV0_9PLEO|nr:FAD-binding domain-containing protein [Dothidotthia symphoricarpi CBS 119687]KAF2130675.1 FAD-binding domain-containing protein [Dothidotthia symphoricarpi CBS 119687]